MNIVLCSMTHNQVVPGSSPGGTTTNIKPYLLEMGFFIVGH